MKISKVFMTAALSIATAVSSTCARAETFDPLTTLVIDQPITGRTMAPVSDRMNRYISSGRAPKEIKLIIDSPGGSVYTGFRFIVQMKALQARGTNIKCYVPGLAASMAFHILVHCNERIVLEESALLWHRARVFVFMAAVTSPAAAALARDLAQVDDHILNDVHQALRKDMSDEDIRYHFEHETLHIGQDLCNKTPTFCTSKGAVPGLLEVLASKDVMRTSDEPADFFGKDSMIYLYTKYLIKLLTK